MHAGRQPWRCIASCYCRPDSGVSANMQGLGLLPNYTLAALHCAGTACMTWHGPILITAAQSSTLTAGIPLSGGIAFLEYVLWMRVCWGLAVRSCHLTSEVMSHHQQLSHWLSYVAVSFPSGALPLQHSSGRSSCRHTGTKYMSRGLKMLLAASRVWSLGRLVKGSRCLYGCGQPWVGSKGFQRLDSTVAVRTDPLQAWCSPVPVHVM